jgi:hypothetical protein
MFRQGVLAVQTAQAALVAAIAAAALVNLPFPHQREKTAASR